MKDLKAKIYIPTTMGPDDERKLYDSVNGVLSSEEYSPFNSSRYAVFPGFCDVHVHLREPGFSYKETIKSGSLAGARGGYTDLCAMPNLKPVADSPENVKLEQDIIDRDGAIDVHPYGAITKGELGEELVDMEAMAPHIVAFSDDGRGVQDRAIMKEAMERARALNKVIVAHCEDESLLEGGYIHKGEYALLRGHRGICSESEWKQVERDVELAAETGCSYHVCHVSTRESVEILRNARKSGVDVTGETAPHYLLLTDMDIKEEGRFKMNPPIRSSADREALIEGVTDGTLGMLITDHAPHSEEEKSRGLQGSAFGIVGLETCFPLIFTELVERGRMSIDRVLDALTVAPRRRFDIRYKGGFSIWDLKEEYRIDPKEFLSKGRATPFEDWRVKGKCILTFHEGGVRYFDKERMAESV